MRAGERQTDTRRGVCLVAQMIPGIPRAALTMVGSLASVVSDSDIKLLSVNQLKM